MNLKNLIKTMAILTILYVPVTKATSCLPDKVQTCIEIDKGIFKGK